MSQRLDNLGVGYGNPYRTDRELAVFMDGTKTVEEAEPLRPKPKISNSFEKANLRQRIALIFLVSISVLTAAIVVYQIASYINNGYNPSFPNPPPNGNVTAICEVVDGIAPHYLKWVSPPMEMLESNQTSILRMFCEGPIVTNPHTIEWARNQLRLISNALADGTTELLTRVSYDPRNPSQDHNIPYYVYHLVLHALRDFAFTDGRGPWYGLEEYYYPGIAKLYEDGRISLEVFRQVFFYAASTLCKRDVTVQLLTIAARNYTCGLPQDMAKLISDVVPKYWPTG